MTTALRAVWLSAESNFQGSLPEARCGHVAASIKNHAAWGDEFIIIHGGINREREALDSLAVLGLDQGSWNSPSNPTGPGPSARAFHAGAVLGRRLYVFGGHVYVKQQARLHAFNDLWCLDTDTWEWARLETEAEAPTPCPRDRACLVASLDGSSLLLYGGADASNRRLDDLWRYDIAARAWAEVGAAGGARPRPRCSATLCALPNRLLLFGGDNYGVSGELWSLNVVVERAGAAVKTSREGPGGDGKPATGPAPPATASWTLLSLEGAVPLPRRGHAAAASGRGFLVSGGFTEHRSLIGIKSRGVCLDDVSMLDREAESLVWRAAVPGSNDAATPCAREKHSLTAVSDGRLLLFGAGLAYLPAVPLGLTSAFSSLRDRLGLPATAPAADLLPLGVLASEFDPALLALGQRVLDLPSGTEGDRGRAVQAARSFLASCSHEELRGDVGALVADYRRLARAGFCGCAQRAARGRRGPVPHAGSVHAPPG
ncbi:Host cell factor 1 [Auxenochlorella protothecoides]|uniref:Host cell factor 1 n=1 Tax=Auxenochlorella protothecoides TaxID=3075 RepID=A0A087SSL6_AUXPR|nr:Host cell factor 1 [Auxenochlorella protothecoides]KFM28720.1 Host cell factor 1 [Auxenochlorella protothecoides]